ncbi:hypothetical protein D9615_001863 [Tricholomella constricta]|uniref:Uncharacterized protein n=1 Tax=Tricholomella constricta TaxID=117010 RepID=A0A8H5HPI1_9AGAR|nr:hypothetical protein D9615_001863 [Tricholomella constricta]
MGGAASKAASKAGRKLPKRAETPSWAGVRTPHASEQPLADRRASETRTEEIDRDARDPDFLANLNRLGPVRVDHHMQTIRPKTTETKQLFKSRLESEHEASSLLPVHNRLHAASLSELLDKQKAARSAQDVERLAKQYGIDVAKLENLTRFVTSPSVQGGTAVRTVEKDGEESVMMMAVWIKPHLQK